MAEERPQVEPTDDFQEILPLCWWPEQVEYERIRRPVLFARAEALGPFFVRMAVVIAVPVHRRVPQRPS